MPTRQKGQAEQIVGGMANPKHRITPHPDARLRWCHSSQAVYALKAPTFQVGELRICKLIALHVVPGSLVKERVLHLIGIILAHHLGGRRSHLFVCISWLHHYGFGETCHLFERRRTRWYFHDTTQILLLSRRCVHFLLCMATLCAVLTAQLA